MRRMSIVLLIAIILVGAFIVGTIGRRCDFGSNNWFYMMDAQIGKAESVIIEGLSDTDIVIGNPQQLEILKRFDIMLNNKHRRTISKYVDAPLCIINYVSGSGEKVPLTIYRLSSTVTNENDADSLYFILNGSQCIAEFRGRYFQMLFSNNREFPNLISELAEQ